MGKRLTKLSAAELENFFLLLPRIFSDYRDPRRGPFELLYLYGETTDNDQSSMLRVIELANSGAMRSLGVADGDTGHGYAGFDITVGRLKALGWKDQVPIVKLVNVGSNFNTRSEAQKLVEYALMRAGDIGIVAPPFHMVRCFMTMVTVIGREPVRVYAVPGAPLPWGEHVAHSQGVLKNTRAGLLGDELKRLERYRAMEFGSMLSAGDVLKYLEWRDA